MVSPKIGQRAQLIRKPAREAEPEVSRPENNAGRRSKLVKSSYKEKPVTLNLIPKDDFDEF